MNQDTSMNRPAVLENISETQMQELERQFEQQDQDGWKQLTESYGWSQDDSNALWQWFSEKPSAQ